jgi:hypothetical protein
MKISKENKMRKVVCLVLLVFLISAISFAGEKNKVGLTLKVNQGATIGFILNLSERVALRPVFGFSHEESDQDSYDSSGNVIITESEEYTSFDAGVGILFYLFKSKRISGYVGVEYIYMNGKRENVYKTKDHVANAMFGLQYRLLKNLWLFGEAGLRYQHSTDDAEGQCYQLDTGGYICSQGYRDKGNKWRTYTSGIGVIFYF